MTYPLPIPSPWDDDMVLANRKPQLIHEARQAMLVALNGYAKNTKRLAPVGFKDYWREILMLLAGGIEIEDSELRLACRLAESPDDAAQIRALSNRTRSTANQKTLELLSHPSTALAVAQHVQVCAKVMLDARDHYIKENDKIRAIATDSEPQKKRRKRAHSWTKPSLHVVKN